MSYISLQHVDAIFDAKSVAETIALKQLDFGIEAGQCIILRGANGSGKTTLLRLLSGALKPTSGEITLRGEANATDFLRRNVSFLRQRAIDGLLATLSLAENVALFTRQLDSSFFSPYARSYGFTQFEDMLTSKVPFYKGSRTRRAIELSGGEQQKFAIALARLQRKTVVLLDEPTSSLDAASYDWVCCEIADWIISGTLTVVIVTHDSRLITDLGKPVYELSWNGARSIIHRVSEV